jgi:hypothetical protein
MSDQGGDKEPQEDPKKDDQGEEVVQDPSPAKNDEVKEASPSAKQEGLNEDSGE